MGEQLTGTIFPCARVCDVDLARGMDKAQEHAWQYWDGILLVVDVCHLTTEVVVDPVRKILIPDTGHPIADYTHACTRELEVEVDAIEEGQCRTKRVADDGDGRCAMCCKRLLDVREDRRCGAAHILSAWMRSNNGRGAPATYLACSEAKPLCASTEDGIPGKRDELNGPREKLTSVRSASLI